uniref:Putative secreted protein n=1 Tax=Anopheles darlingi TaxID=43151 RepID=A0A2M4DG38_ANODA
MRAVVLMGVAEAPVAVMVAAMLLMLPVATELVAASKTIYAEWRRLIGATCGRWCWHLATAFRYDRGPTHR